MTLLPHNTKKRSLRKVNQKDCKFKNHTTSFTFQKIIQIERLYAFSMSFAENKVTLKFHNGHYKINICLDSIRSGGWRQFLRFHTDRRTSLSPWSLLFQFSKRKWADKSWGDVMEFENPALSHCLEVTLCSSKEWSGVSHHSEHKIRTYKRTRMVT